MKEPSVNETINILIEKFKLNNFNIIGIDKDDILWSSKNDDYGISWDIKTQNIELYYGGYQVGFLSEKTITNESEIDIKYYKTLLIAMISSVNDNVDIISEIDRGLRKYILFERFEEAEQLKKFLKLLS